MAADPRFGRVGLRLRVAALAAVAVAIALAVGAFLLVGLLRSRLDTAASTAATLRARDIAALARSGALPQLLALPGEESAFVQVIDRAGHVVATTGNIDGEPPIETRRPTTAGHALTMTLNVHPLSEVDKMRVVALTTSTPSGDVTVYAGESLEAADDTISAVLAGLIAGSFALIVVVGGVSWWAVGRTLRPVRAITRTMADITASDLHRRVLVPAARDEIGELATTVNETLARLDLSVEQQRRFVADASHELRGPLAALRSDLEISVVHPERTVWHDVARDTLADVEHLQQLTEDLLLLAQTDARSSRRPTAVDLNELVVAAAQTIRRGEITVTIQLPDCPVIVSGDAAQLHRMIRNLVHNAEQYANQSITIRLDTMAGGVRLTIGDDGPGIPVDRRAEVFERFVRLDTARTRDDDAGGIGLGLAIVRDVVHAHGGTITISDTDPHGATFTIDMP